LHLLTGADGRARLHELELVARRASKRDLSADGEQCDVAAMVAPVEGDLCDARVRSIAGGFERVTGCGYRQDATASGDRLSVSGGCSGVQDVTRRFDVIEPDDDIAAARSLGISAAATTTVTA